MYDEKDSAGGNKILSKISVRLERIFLL